VASASFRPKLFPSDEALATKRLPLPRCASGTRLLALHDLELRPSPSSNRLLEIVRDYFPNASSCRAYADEEFGPETLQMQAFRLHY
jgi:hypothetical protein